MISPRMAVIAAMIYADAISYADARDRFKTPNIKKNWKKKTKRYTKKVK